MFRYIKLYKSFARNCLIREMEFRLNFLIRTVIFFCWAGLGYASIFLIYNQVDKVGDWDKYEMLLLTTVFGFANAFLKATLYNNINRLPGYIKDGEMDFMLTKPLNIRFLVSTRYFNFEQIPRLLIYLYLILRFTHLVNPSLNTSGFFAGLFLIFLGILGMYSFLFMISCIPFWRPRVWNLFAVVRNLESLADKPSDIFRGFLRLLVTLLPIAAFATIPTKFLLGEGSIKLFLGAILVSIAFFFISQLIWNLGLRQYESASS